MGYDAAGGLEPGGGPLTDQHNMQFTTPDAAEVSARLPAVGPSAPLVKWRVCRSRNRNTPCLNR